MKHKLLPAVAFALAALLAPAIAVASQEGDLVQVRDNEEPTPIGWTIKARSGPNGEDPEGTIRRVIPSATRTFDVTCLSVSGTKAVVGGVGASGGVLAWVSGFPDGEGKALFEEVDPELVDCSTPQPQPFDNTHNAAVVVHDG